MTRVVLAAELQNGGLDSVAGVAAHWARCGIAVQRVGAIPDAVDGDVLVVWSDRTPDEATQERLVELARRGTPLLLLGPTLAAWRGAQAVLDAAGVLPGALTQAHEIRLVAGRDGPGVATRMGGELCVSDRLLLLDKVADDVEQLLCASWRLADHAVATWRPESRVGTFNLAGDALDDPRVLRLLHRWLRHALGLDDGPDVRVGILGYGAIGHEHSAAIAAVPGLHLTAVCDRNVGRLAEARLLAPDVRTCDDAEQLVGADDVDLVIVSTPPNTHASWVLRALDAGQHVVVEKPFCLTVAEADEMVALAAERDRLLAVYQNRRWDADYLALRDVVRSGAIGDVFHLESFVGGYGHPCSYWHSDAEVSGGAVYDWGSHHLDWTLDLIPQPVRWVSATTQKRVWHDVSNADHSRVTLGFADGAEAEFVHSDLAAALKPKWYVLGTRGAVRGDWRHESVLARDAVGNLVEDPLAAAESPATLTVCTPVAGGGVSEQRLAIPPAPAQPFHRELADALLGDEPMSITAAGSRRNIAVMEAATRSAAEGGRPVELADLGA